MISGQVSLYAHYVLFLLRVSNPVNPVNPVNHNKVLRRFLILPFYRKCNNDLHDYED